MVIRCSQRGLFTERIIECKAQTWTLSFHRCAALQDCPIIKKASQLPIMRQHPFAPAFQIINDNISEYRSLAAQPWPSLQFSSLPIRSGSHHNHYPDMHARHGLIIGSACLWPEYVKFNSNHQGFLQRRP